MRNIGTKDQGTISVTRRDVAVWRCVTEANYLQQQMPGEAGGEASEEPIVIHADFPTEPLPQDTFAGAQLQQVAAKPSSYDVNATESFWVLGKDSGGKRKEVQKTFKLYRKSTDNHKGTTWTVYYWADFTAYEALNTNRKDDKIGFVDIRNVQQKFSNGFTEKDILGQSIDIFGAPWGQHTYGGAMIGADRKDIHVLLFDIAADSYVRGQGRIVGYFNSHNNQSNGFNGNQKLMIAIDSVILSRFPNSIYSTFVHEFQHLINFYQRVMRLSPDNLKTHATWFAEMLAQMAVDLVLPKVEGLALPAGATPLDRSIGGYLRGPWDSMTRWMGGPLDYYSVSAFGAYLLRHHAKNGKSSELIKEIMTNAYVNKQAVTAATGKTWKELLTGWGQQTLDSYQATDDLAAIDAWKLIKMPGFNTPIGIPMFHLPLGTGKFKHFEKDGSLPSPSFSYDNINNEIKFPQPDSQIYIYLGKPTVDTPVDLKFSKDSGLAYELVVH